MTRIENYRNYLINVLDELKKDFNIMNINFLSNNVDDYCLTKIPTKSVIETSITGIITCKDVYNFSGRFTYSSNVADNLDNMGFWETFENKIYSNNEQGVLPDNIDNKTINKNVYCLNCGSLQNAQTQDCEMSIQIEFDYEKEE